jgi:hypothetical protein
MIGLKAESLDLGLRSSEDEMSPVVEFWDSSVSLKAEIRSCSFNILTGRSYRESRTYPILSLVSGLARSQFPSVYSIDDLFPIN